LLLEKLRYRFEHTELRFLPKNLFKLSNYVKFGNDDTYDKIVKRILILKFIGYIYFNKDLGIEYRTDKTKFFDSLDEKKFDWLCEQVFLDGEYVIQMLKHSNIDLRCKDFANLYNLVSSYLKRDRDYILDVACYIYIYQRTEIPL
jgi:hypothetical protein